ncbi:MAG: OmpH family outer membrane protein [Bacteroidales bacterium]|jgi:outer membrane protein|nr:OmpH family outer membrane protein [Bacteroidales bacterium]MCR5696705.1 OmpH family outer membrane protein [Marinilabiliaceae bacterium]
MKKTFTLISLALAAIATGCVNNNANDAGKVACQGCDSTKSAVAYINTDTFLLNYKYAQKLSDELMSQSESSRSDFNQKYRVFQQDAMEFQRKVQNNGFLSMERAQKEQSRLQKAEQDLQELNERLTNDLMQKQAKVNAELRDTLVNFLNEYAANRYSLILSNNMGDNVLYSAPGVNITNEVVDALNARYKE